jgi:hypothetical protein
VPVAYRRYVTYCSNFLARSASVGTASMQLVRPISSGGPRTHAAYLIRCTRDRQATLYWV